VIYVGYTPGYIGWYPYYDTVVYGTGYRYPCWRRNHYYPRQWTFGFMPRYYYYPVIGWGYGYSWGYGFMTIGWNWNYDWRCNGWYGPGNYHGYYPRVHNPRRDFTQYKSVNMYRNANIGNQVSVGKKSYKIDRNNPRNIYSRKDNVNRVAFTPQTKVNLTRASVSQGKPNNVLIDKDGNAFRNNKNGWQKNTGKVWSQATPEAKGVVGSQGTSQPGGKIQTYGRAQTQSQPQTQTQTQTQSRTQTQTQPQSQTQTRTPSYGQSQSQSLSQTKSSKPVVPEHVQNEYQARQRGDERAYKSAPSSGSSQGSQPKSETPKYSGGQSSGSQRSNDTPRSSGGSSSGSQGSYGTSRSGGSSSSGGSRSSGSSGRSQSSSGRHR
jgi:hypothetical protein